MLARGCAARWRVRSSAIRCVVVVVVVSAPRVRHCLIQENEKGVLILFLRVGGCSLSVSLRTVSPPRRAVDGIAAGQPTSPIRRQSCVRFFLICASASPLTRHRHPSPRARACTRERVGPISFVGISSSRTNRRCRIRIKRYKQLAYCCKRSQNHFSYY